MVDGDDERMKAILREAFGDSSSESDGGASSIGDSSSESDGGASSIDRRGFQSVFGDTKIWEAVTEINGLWICRDFLSADEQSSLLTSLEKDGYLGDDSHNQAMKFGDLPPWANELSCVIRENVLLHGFSSEPMGLTSIDDNTEESILFPSELLWREPLFDQFIFNVYQPGEGIGGHVDLLRFEDGIAIISLESSCVMHFSSVEAEANHHKECVPSGKIPVLLTPGSLVLMWGDARYLWKHEINRKPGFQIWNCQEIEQKRRTSLTLRRLCRSE